MRIKKYLKLLLIFLVVLLGILYLRSNKEKPMKMNNPHNVKGVVSYNARSTI